MLPKRLSNKALATVGLSAGALLLGIQLTSANQVNPIGLEKAKAIALADAQVKADKVRFITAEADFDDNRKVYDIEFYDGNKEYDYEIGLSDGRIVERDFDVEYFAPFKESKPATKSPSTNQTSSQTSPAVTPAPAQTSSASTISDSRGKEIALSDAKLSEKSVSYLKVESEHDDDFGLVYDVEFYDPATNREYDYTIDRKTGRILEIDEDMESYVAVPQANNYSQAPATPSVPAPATPSTPAPATAPSQAPSPAPVYRGGDDWDDRYDDDRYDDWDDHYDDDRYDDWDDQYDDDDRYDDWDDHYDDDWND